MREVIVYKWDNSLLKLKLSSYFTGRHSALDLVERPEEAESPTFLCQSLECSLFFVCLSASFYVYSTDQTF